MSWIKRLMRSPWFWFVFIAVQFLHPRTPLSYTLWVSFGTQRDTVDVDSLHGKRLGNGDLEVRADVLRRVEWFGAREELVARKVVLHDKELRVIQNRYRLAEPILGPYPLRNPIAGELPIVQGSFCPPTEFEALSNGPLGTGWTSGWKDEGEWLVGYRVRLPLKQDGDLPWSQLLRVVLTPFALVADFLALPVILGQLLVMMYAMSSAGGH